MIIAAWVVVTDSGGIQEEAPSFGLPVIIARETTERPEVVETGFGRLVGSSYESIAAGVRAATGHSQRQFIVGANPFGRGDAGHKVANHLLKLNRRGHTNRTIRERISA